MSTRVLYIGGASRSGSTVLERLVGLLPRTQTLGEVRHLWSRGVLEDQRCGCGEVFSRCPLWTDVGRKAFGGWDSVHAENMVMIQNRFDRSWRIPSNVWRSWLRRQNSAIVRYADAHARVYRAAKDLTNSLVVVDSSKHVSQPYTLLGRQEIDLRVVQLVRDPRGVAYSWSKSVVRPEITGAVEFMPQFNPLKVALDWDVQNALFAFGRLTHTPRMVLRYEDLISNPRGSIAAIARFAGLEFPEMVGRVLDSSIVDLGVQHSVAGNPMRFKPGLVRLRSDQSWREHLTGRDRILVSAATGPIRAAYGRN